MTHPYTLPPLPYGYDELEPWCSATTLQLHHDKHHQAYVDGANRAESALREVDPEDTMCLAGIREDLAFQLGGHILHSLFWENLCPEPVAAPQQLRSMVEDQYGSFDRFCQLFVATAVGVHGSGWGMLSFDRDHGRLVLSAVRDHHLDHVPGLEPLAVVDVWEHAYYLDHQNKRAEWVKAAVEHLDWQIVNARLSHADRRVGVDR